MEREKVGLDVFFAFPLFFPLPLFLSLFSLFLPAIFAVDLAKSVPYGAELPSIVEQAIKYIDAKGSPSLFLTSILFFFLF